MHGADIVFLDRMAVQAALVERFAVGYVSGGSGGDGGEHGCRKGARDEEALAPAATLFRLV
jgi:hypothetical protein